MGNKNSNSNQSHSDHSRPSTDSIRPNKQKQQTGQTDSTSSSTSATTSSKCFLFCKNTKRNNSIFKNQCENEQRHEKRFKDLRQRMNHLLPHRRSKNSTSTSNKTNNNENTLVTSITDYTLFQKNDNFNKIDQNNSKTNDIKLKRKQIVSVNDINTKLLSQIDENNNFEKEEEDGCYKFSDEQLKMIDPATIDIKLLHLKLKQLNSNQSEEEEEEEDEIQKENKEKEEEKEEEEEEGEDELDIIKPFFKPSFGKFTKSPAMYNINLNDIQNDNSNKNILISDILKKQHSDSLSSSSLSSLDSVNIRNTLLSSSTTTSSMSKLLTEDINNKTPSILSSMTSSSSALQTSSSSSSSTMSSISLNNNNINKERLPFHSTLLNNNEKERKRRKLFVPNDSPITKVNKSQSLQIIKPQVHHPLKVEKVEEEDQFINNQRQQQIRYKRALILKSIIDNLNFIDDDDENDNDNGDNGDTTNDYNFDQISISDINNNFSIINNDSSIRNDSLNETLNQQQQHQPHQQQQQQQQQQKKTMTTSVSMPIRFLSEVNKKLVFYATSIQRRITSSSSSANPKLSVVNNDKLTKLSVPNDEPLLHLNRPIVLKNDYIEFTNSIHSDKLFNNNNDTITISTLSDKLAPLAQIEISSIYDDDIDDTIRDTDSIHSERYNFINTNNNKFVRSSKFDQITKLNQKFELSINEN
jgi:hypothetical protein